MPPMRIELIAKNMEESFGTEKESYHLKKIKTRTQKNEELMIFFEVHTANAKRISDKMQERSQGKSAA